MKMKKIAALLSAAAMTFSALSLPAAASESSEKSIKDMVAAMSTEQKIEQMIMITLRPWATDGGYQNVTSLNEQQRSLIKDHNFAGVCLFAANIQSVEQTVALTTEIQQAALDSECGIPMLISADQEGGSIYRLTTGTPTCGNMALGATNDPDLAEENAKILGSEIMSLGINTDFAPVVDVNNNPSNPVINIRSYSSDPELVSKMGASYIKGLHSEGVITTCKHFPGHGDTGTDSHTGLPLINKSYDELKKLELVPYSTVTKDTDMIMTAHIQFPKIETGTYTSKLNGEEINIPATLSKTMITDVLRKDYGFDGVVTTDSMVMAAIQQNFDLIDSATLAINADVDIILEPMYIQSADDIAKLEQYIKDIAKQVEDGKISIDTIDKSVTRILTMKQQRGVLDYTAPDAEKAGQIVGCAEHRENALETAKKAVTLVKNDDDLLPLKLDDGAKIAYFFPYSNVENTLYFALDELKESGVVPDTVTTDCICHQGHKASEYEENVKNCDVVILAFEMYSAANLDKTNESRGWQAAFTDDLIELAHKNDKKVVYLSANIPYDAARFQSADAIVLAYNADGMDELPVNGKENPAYGVNYPAALITILGGNSPTGKLPVDIYAVDENSQYTDEILYEQGYCLEYKNEKTDISTGTVTVDTDNKTVTVTVDGETVPESEYHVNFFIYEETEDGEIFTKIGSDFPTEAGTYLAGVVANEDSEIYIGENRSEPFTITESESDDTTPDSSSKKDKSNTKDDTKDKNDPSSSSSKGSASGTQTSGDSGNAKTPATDNPATGEQMPIATVAVLLGGALIIVGRKNRK